jgi:hypothetical protein
MRDATRVARGISIVASGRGPGRQIAVSGGLGAHFVGFDRRAAAAGPRAMNRAYSPAARLVERL